MAAVSLIEVSSQTALTACIELFLHKKDPMLPFSTIVQQIRSHEGMAGATEEAIRTAIAENVQHGELYRVDDTTYVLPPGLCSESHLIQLSKMDVNEILALSTKTKTDASQ